MVIIHMLGDMRSECHDGIRFRLLVFLRCDGSSTAKKVKRCRKKNVFGKMKAEKQRGQTPNVRRQDFSSSSQGVPCEATDESNVFNIHPVPEEVTEFDPECTRVFGQVRFLRFRNFSLILESLDSPHQIDTAVSGTFKVLVSHSQTALGVDKDVDCV
jgi:hypothetical protein